MTRFHLDSESRGYRPRDQLSSAIRDVAIGPGGCSKIMCLRLVREI
jgi:hypothetical protein